MTTSAETQPTAIADPSLASDLPESFVALASPDIRALAAQWIASSQAYFRALERWEQTSNAPPNRNQVETECDIAILEDEAVRRRIIDLRSTETGGLALKAAVFVVHLPPMGDADTLIGEIVGDEGPTAEALAVALARDVAEVLGPTVQALADAARPGRPS